MRSDWKLVLNAVGQDFRALALASDHVRNDREFVQEAMRIAGGRVMAGASIALRSDRELLLEAVRIEGRALACAYPWELREDRDLVLEAVRQDWRALAHAAPELQADRGVVFEAVKRNRDGWQALQFAPEKVCADREILFEAVRQDPEALRWAADEIRTDPELQQAALQSGFVFVGGHEAPTPRCSCGKWMV